MKLASKNAIAFGAALSCLLVTSSSFAQDRPETAEELFEQGRSLVFQKKYAEACPKLAQSLKIDPGLGTRLWLADCYEKNGQTASAWKQFKLAATAAEERKDDRARVAARRASSLEEKLSRIVIRVATSREQASGIEVRCDGRVIPASDLSTPQAVDPGFHTIAATAPDHEAWSATVEVPARPDSVSVTVPVLRATPVTKVAAASSPAVTIPSKASSNDGAKDATPATTTTMMTSMMTSTEQKPVGYWSGMRIGAVTAGVLGLAAIGGSAFMGFRAQEQYDASFEDDHCTTNNACDATGKSRREEANATATMATVAFGAGAAAIGTGIVLWLLAPSKSEGTIIAPSVGFRDAGVSLTRRW